MSIIYKQSISIRLWVTVTNFIEYWERIVPIAYRKRMHIAPIFRVHIKVLNLFVAVIQFLFRQLHVLRSQYTVLARILL